MFHRDVKKQFNENKYNVLTAKGMTFKLNNTSNVGAMQRSQLSKVPFQKQLVGSLALIVLGFNFTKRYYTFPHAHKDESKPMLLLNGELHPYENQPAVFPFHI